MNRDLLLVAISLMAWGLGEGMFFYFQPVYLKELGANPVTIGAILGASGLVMTISHIPAGYLSDKIGRKPLITVSWVTGMVAAWMMAIAQTLPAFMAGLLVYSVTAFVISPLNSYVTAARGRLSVGRALTIISSFYNGGAILGPFLGGLIGGEFGLRSIYRFSASIFIASVTVILFIRPQSIEHHSIDGSRRRLHIDKRYFLYLVIIFISMFATYLPQPLTPNFLQDLRGVTVEQLGELGSIASIGVVIMNLTLGSISPHIGYMIAQACVAAFAIAIWQGTGMPWYMVGYFLLGGYRAGRVLAAAQTRYLVDKANMGLAYGITETVSTSAAILAPPIAGFIFTTSPTQIYSLSVVLIGLSLIATLFFSPSRTIHKSDTAEE